MEKKGHFLRRTAGLLALLMALSLFAAGCGEKPGDPDKPDAPDADTQPKPTDIVLVEPDAPEVPVDFETAQKTWPDVYAYMKIPGASNMAIREGNFLVQRPGDDDYYLNRDLDGKDNKAGTMYTQASLNKPDMSDPVTVIYGHNMRNGTMLGGLLNYANAMHFEDKPVVEVYQPGRKMTYRIFAAIPYDSSLILGTHDFTDEQDFTGFFTALGKAATDKNYTSADEKNAFCPSLGSVHVNTDDLPVWGDKVIILSTCIGDDRYRYLMLAKLVEDSNEPLEMTREEAEKAGLTDHIIGLAPAKDAAGGADAAAPVGTDTAKQDAAKTDTSKKGN